MKTNFAVESLIKKDDREKIYKVIYIGVSVYNRLLKDNPQLEDSEFFSEIRSRVLNFFVKRQFEEDILSKDFPFKIEIKKINGFGNKALFLQNDFARMKISKNKSNKLYNGNKISKYMLDEAKINSKHEKQIKLVILDNRELEVQQEKRTFVILSYGINGKEFDHIDFIIPNSDMKSSIETFNALDEFNETVKISAQDENVEKRIVELKDKAKKVIYGN
ncbi:hypothetical protein [Clostridium ihumii]|uniref:hypothetical protein n=1 Tax=Clostridium ihumii TaxID=1470356 RepID=UPI00054F4486|nr:hypothetical protein [Clostridium ihumii]